MNKTYVLTVFIFVTNICQSQKFDGLWQFNITPSIGNRAIKFKDNVTNQFKDSIKKADGWRTSIGGGIGYNMITSKKTRLYFGLQYQNMGFTRTKKNLKFRDTIHPEIGRVNDLSQTGEIYVDFNYRYHYFALPFLYDAQFYANKEKSTTLHWLAGGSIAGLFKHDIRAVLRGFSAFGEKVFILKNEDEQAALINANIHLGLRLENIVYKNTWIFAQPMVYIPILNANYGKERHHLYSLGVEVGIAFKIEEKKKVE